MPASASISSPAIAITGWGLVSPLGNSAWETFAKLLTGRCTSDRLAKLEPDLSAVDVACAVGGVNIARHGPDPAIELAERAAREAIFMADQRTGSPIPPDQTHWLMGSSKGAAHAFHAAADLYGGRRGIATRLGPPPPPDAALAVALGPHGYLSHHLQRRLGVATGIRQVVGACASSLIALHQASQMLLHTPPAERPRRVVVLTSEAALLELFIASYQRLGVLPRLTADDQGQYHYLGRPLDGRRDGFLLAELGAAVVLEVVDDPRPGMTLLADTAHAADGFDLMRTDPTMPALSHVASKLLAGSPVDLIHAHATGTQDHDPAELAVYAGLIARPTPIYAVKGALGHGLGAAGLVSTVLACLCAQTGQCPPMPWLESPIAAGGPLALLHRHLPAKAKLARQAIFAAGFGGHVAGAVIQRV